MGSVFGAVCFYTKFTAAVGVFTCVFFFKEGPSKKSCVCVCFFDSCYITFYAV